MGCNNLVWPGKAEAALSITFDDGYRETVENTSRWLFERQLSATYFIISEKVDASFEGIATASWDVLRQADRSGHEIACHGASHTPFSGIGSDLRRLVLGSIIAPDRMRFLWQSFYRVLQVYSLHHPTDRSPLDLVKETAGAKRDTENQIAGKNVESFAYPAGRYNQAAQKALATAGFRSGRSLDPGINGKCPAWYALKAISLTQRMRLQDIYRWVEAAIKQNGWLILVFHQIRQTATNEYLYTYPLDDFQQLVCDFQAGPFWIASQREVTRFLLKQPQ